MRKQLVPDIVNHQQLVTLDVTASAREAARLMNANKVSSVLVMENEKLAGIFTVRDVARRVVGSDKDPDTTPLKEVMTKEPQCIAPTEGPLRALELMHRGGYRHLPVVENGEVIAILSRRNFQPEEEALLEFEGHMWESI